MKKVIDRIDQALAALGIPKRKVKSTLAEACGISYESVRQWYEKGDINIRHDNLEAISKKFGLSIDYLLTGKGEMFTKVDLRDKKKELYFDAPPLRFHNIPLVPWGKAIAAKAAIENNNASKIAEAWMTSAIQAGACSFYVRYQGQAMSPDYRDGELLCVDPDVKPANGRDVLVSMPDGSTVFRRLVDSSDGRTLMALNPQWPDRFTPLPTEASFIGVVVSSQLSRV